MWSDRASLQESSGFENPEPSYSDWWIFTQQTLSSTTLILEKYQNQFCWEDKITSFFGYPRLLLWDNINYNLESRIPYKRLRCLRYLKFYFWNVVVVEKFLVKICEQMKCQSRNKVRTSAISSYQVSKNASLIFHISQSWGCLRGQSRWKPMFT